MKKAIIAPFLITFSLFVSSASFAQCVTMAQSPGTPICIMDSSQTCAGGDCNTHCTHVKLTVNGPCVGFNTITITPIGTSSCFMACSQVDLKGKGLCNLMPETITKNSGNWTPGSTIDFVICGVTPGSTYQVSVPCCGSLFIVTI